MKKIILKTEACIGCGACVAIDSEHFTFNEEGYSEIISQENLESHALLDSMDACPVAIINIEEVIDIKEITKTCECNPCECEDCHCKEEQKKAA